MSNIVWAASEVFPYAKTGGLADVSGALPQSLAERGHKVSVIMPYYPQVMKNFNKDIVIKKKLLGVPFGWGTEWAQILEHKINENLSIYFIEFHQFFDRPTLYDYDGVEFSDNAERFIFFSRAVMQAVLALELKPDILHTNDWHTALCNVYLKSHLYEEFDNFKNCKSILTIHNIGYQGVFNKSNILWTNLGWEYFNYHCLEFYDQINLMKAGVLTADVVNTVSPTYAAEILTAEYAFNLENPLQQRASEGKLRGIVNGIDIEEWNPEKDKELPFNYSISKIAGKAKCKKALQKEFGLPVSPKTPLFGIVSRLAIQKGIDVFLEAVEDMLIYDDIQFAIVGSGDKVLQGWLNALANKYPNKISFFSGYSNKKAHLVEAGCDAFIMPSRYEPCGLNQLYSMRYGTIPIVRATGGLEDTVINYEYSNIKDATGFKFWDLNPDALRGTMRWAASIFRDDRKSFNQIRKNGMSQDFSWEHTAKDYENLYDNV